MAAVKSQLKSDLVAAMKAHDDKAKSAIRMAISAISAEEVAGDSARELTDDQEQAIITKQVNVRKDSAHAYRDAGRDELAEAEESELAILQKYLPAQLEESEVRTIVDEEIAKAADGGPATMKLMGSVMKAVQARVKGRFDGKTTAALVKGALS